MPYHVYVWYTPKGGRHDEFYELDLDEQGLRKNIVEPYLRGERFMCSGKPIDPLEDHQIIISETVVPSSMLIPKIRMEKKLGHLTLGVRDEYYVVDWGRDVTRKFISSPPKKVIKTEKAQRDLSKNVFIVHGRDDRPALELANILQNDFGLNPIILREKEDRGNTIAEKLERYSEDVGYAFVILTPDDVGSLKEDYDRDGKIYPRARQNAVMEFGYFWGLLNRSRVCCLVKGEVEKPSDIAGVIYKPFKDRVKECYREIAKELKAAGYKT